MTEWDELLREYSPVSGNPKAGCHKKRAGDERMKMCFRTNQNRFKPGTDFAFIKERGGTTCQRASGSVTIKTYPGEDSRL